MSSSTVTNTPPSTPPDLPPPGRLVLRADGGEGVGAGHVARCLALAEAWVAAGGSAELAVTPGGAVHARRLGASVPVRELDVDAGTPDDIAATADLGGGWLVLDGYRFGPGYRPADGRLLVVDDHAHGRAGAADVLLDQNLGARAEDYPAVGDARLLLGPTYALLRAGAIRVGPRTDDPRRVVVNTGGEPSAAVLDAVRAVTAALAAEGLAVDVIGGADATQIDAVPGVTVHGFVANPEPLLVEADLAVTPAGSTVYGLCRAGIPAVVAAFHDNQERIATALADAGAAVTVPPDPEALVDGVRVLIRDGERRARIAAAAGRLVDGAGADRVVAELRSWER